MAKTIYLDKLIRLTLTRKGKAIAKHPSLREGVIEAVKAEPLWTAVKADDDDELWYDDEVVGDPEADDWYALFDQAVIAGQVDQFWEAAEMATKAQKKNYPDSDGPFAGPHNSFPIRNQEDVIHAAQRLHNAKGSQSSIRARIVAIARAHGYKLPKSWASKKVSKSMDDEQFKELVAHLSEAIKGLIAPAPVEAPVEPETAEKAKSTMHSHSHPHASLRNYTYSHDHDHGHDADGMANHDSSDSAHGHDHVSKAEELDPAVKADLEGMDEDIKRLKEQVATLETEKAAVVASLKTAQEALAAKEAETAEKAEIAEKATAEAETAKAELSQAVEAAKQPLTAPVPTTAEKATKPIKEMSFDDAFSTLLHG